MIIAWISCHMKSRFRPFRLQGAQIQQSEALCVKTCNNQRRCVSNLVTEASTTLIQIYLSVWPKIQQNSEVKGQEFPQLVGDSIERSMSPNMKHWEEISLVYHSTSREIVTENTFMYN